jgi:hypothetical protein
VATDRLSNGGRSSAVSVRRPAAATPGGETDKVIRANCSTKVSTSARPAGQPFKHGALQDQPSEFLAIGHTKQQPGACVVGVRRSDEEVDVRALSCDGDPAGRRERRCPPVHTPRTAAVRFPKRFATVVEGVERTLTRGAGRNRRYRG